MTINFELYTLQFSLFIVCPRYHSILSRYSSSYKQLNIAEDETVLVTTSRLALKNGLDDLIKSVNHLVYKIGIKTKLIILGTGPDEQKLKDLAKQSGVAANVIFMGYKPYNELPKYVEMADIFIRPSLSEGFGNSFIEAMAVCTPIIGTEVGGISDFLHDGQTGLFCKVRDHISIADAVAKYVKNPELYKTIQNKGQQLVLTKYSWDKIAGEMDKVFKKI